VIYLIFCSLHEAQNVGNTTTFGIWFDDKFREVYAQTTSL